MPEKETLERAHEDAREGKSPSTQAGEFVREEIHHVREGKHGARSAKQAIAIGLSKARRAGVDLPAPKKGSRKTRQAAARDRKRGSRTKPRSAKRSKASLRWLKREGHRAASKTIMMGPFWVLVRYLPSRGAGMPFDQLSTGYSTGLDPRQNEKFIAALVSEIDIWESRLKNDLPSDYTSGIAKQAVDQTSLGRPGSSPARGEL